MRSRRSLWVAGATVILCALIVALALRNTPEKAPGRRLIAVLPFQGSDGLMDELISELASVQTERLGVIAAGSAMRYRFAGSARDAARELNVVYVIDGSVRGSRVTARLIDARNQVVWTGSFEGSEPECAVRISAAVLARWFPKGVMRSTRFRERDRAAYEAYRQGRSLQLQGDPRSVEFFQKSVELDPRDADAYAALASAYVSMARAGGEPEKLFPQAVAAAGKALDIDSTSPEAHNALANARFWFDWNWREAERHFTLALGARPSYAAAHHDYAWFLIAMGRTEQGLAALRRAIELDPFSVRIHMDAGWLLLGAHHFEESIREAKRALDLSPGLEEAHLCIERAQLFLGRNAPAAEGGADPYWLALHYALSGDKLRAMRELHHAYEGHSIMMPLVRVEPAFSALRGDEKFEALVARVGIP